MKRHTDFMLFTLTDEKNVNIPNVVNKMCRNSYL